MTTIHQLNMERILDEQCCVCFEDINPNTSNFWVKCINNTCTLVLCLTCANEYINRSIDESKFPRCPNRTCNQYYNFGEINKLPLQTINKYKLALYKHLQSDEFGIEANKLKALMSLIENMRKERMDYLDRSFPKAIYLVASIAMKRNLNKLFKNQKLRLENRLNSNRVCMNLMCNGLLTIDFVCSKCSTKFCIKCEKELTESHLCNESEVESVQIVNEMVRCPKCNLPIQKSVGCNQMTCSNCKTNFLYTNGIIGGAGSHAQDAPIILRRSTLSYVYRETIADPTIIALITKIEDKQPGDSPQQYRHQIINNLKKSGETPDLKDVDIICKLFDKYIISAAKNRIYQRIISEIEKKIRNLSDDMNKQELIDQLEHYYKILI